MTYSTDADGDGHGVLGAATTIGCKASKGFGLCDGDCNDNDPTIYPGAPELCDGKDNNCNGQVDEGARAECGLGWCARYADRCLSTACTPGAPRAEVCNDFDDDCDGVGDNGTNLELCGKPRLACRAGVCVADPNAASEAPMPSATGGGGGTLGSAGGAGYLGAVGGSGTSSTPATSPAQAPPRSGCALETGGARAPFGCAGLLLALCGLLRRQRRHVATWLHAA